MLTAKQEKFCEEYIKCLNGTKAAIAAGYSPKTARKIASRELTKEDIKLRLKELKDNIADTVGVNAVMLVNELKKIALSNVMDTHSNWMTLKAFNKLTEEQKATISEVSYETKKVGRRTEQWVKLKFYNKITAIDTMSKMLGYNAPQKHEVQAVNVVLSKEEIRDYNQMLENEF